MNVVGEQHQAHFREFHMDGHGMSAVFFPTEIREWCMENFKHYYLTNIGPSAMLSVATKTRRVPVNAQEYALIIQAMLNAFPPKKGLELRIYIMPSPFEKKWDGKGDIGPVHVNSGFTSFSRSTPSKNTIVVFRKEESRKVLIHELIHALQLHCVEHGTFDMVMTEHFDEAIVECWATILNCQYVYLQKTAGAGAGEFEINTRSATSYEELLRTPMFKKEQQHALKQAAKLVKAYDCKVANDKCREKFPSLPAVYSYYIYKAALLFNAGKFVRQFWWPQVKKCKNFQVSVLDDYVNDDGFAEALRSAQTDLRKGDVSMKMTLYGGA